MKVTSTLLSPLVLMLALLLPSAAVAGPIAPTGVWSPAAVLTGDETAEQLALLPFWSGASFDGPRRGVRFLLDEYGATGLEYLNDGTGEYTPFAFDDEILNVTKIFGITLRNGVLGRRADGAFTYDIGARGLFNSLESPEQFALFRFVGLESTRYFLGIEDILLAEQTDQDYNDHVVTFEIPQPVPEPGTLLLLGSGIAALAARRKAAARKLRLAATA